MADKRKDCRGRVLRTGESQRKDGRYVYKYLDEAGRQQFLYSWRLDERDKMPGGKLIEPSLREKVKRLRADMEEGIKSSGGDMTVCDLVQKYVRQKTGVRHNTIANYYFVLNIIKKEPFGGLPIRCIKLSDAKLWLIKLQSDGRGYSTIHSVRGVIRPAFQMAVEDDLIRKNPFDFQLATVVVNDSATREAISRKQERAFLEFVKNDKHYQRYYDGIYILFKTGMRISEFAGLTASSLDMKKRRITIDCQLQRTRKMKYVIERPKTASGNRVIPMSEDVYACFKRILEQRKPPKIEPMVDGRSGFLYLDKNGMPMVALHWEHYFKRICEKYNGIYRTPLPEITPHVCRHTYCSNMAKSGMNPKTLQYLMGHADIGVTLNTYTHLSLEDVEAECRRMSKGK